MRKAFSGSTVYLTEQEKYSKIENNTKKQETDQNNHKNKKKTKNSQKMR